MDKEELSIWWFNFTSSLRYTEPFYTIREWYYSTRNFLFRRYDLIRTGMPKTQWCDKVELMLYGMMNMLKDYVEKEKCFDIIDWEHGEEHSNAAKEIREIYAWWLNYENRQKEISSALNEWHDTKFKDIPVENWRERLNIKDTPETKNLFDHLHELERKLEEEEEEMLIRLIKIRGHLWT